MGSINSIKSVDVCGKSQQFGENFGKKSPRSQFFCFLKKEIKCSNQIIIRCCIYTLYKYSILINNNFQVKKSCANPGFGKRFLYLIQQLRTKFC